MRKFEIVKDEFLKYGEKDIKMPVRATKHSAGYDVFSPIDTVIAPGEVETIWTNLKATCNDDEFFMLCVTSGMGKRGVILANGVGIIDKDYYGNAGNDGNFGYMLRNLGNTDYVIHKGDKIGQVIFFKYLLVDDDVEPDTIRIGGFGSTDRK